MISKAEIVIGGIRDKYPAPESITRSAVLKTHAIDQFAFSARLLQLLYSMQVCGFLYLSLVISGAHDYTLSYKTLHILSPFLLLLNGCVALS